MNASRILDVKADPECPLQTIPPPGQIALLDMDAGDGVPLFEVRRDDDDEVVPHPDVLYDLTPLS